LLGRLALPDLLPVSDTRCKCRFPDPSRVPEVAPGPVPVSGSESISTLPVRTAQEVPVRHFKIL